MGRIRTVKPEFFKHEELFDAEVETGLPLRVAFAGLWTQCDREGRFHWRPRALKTDILPYDNVDFARVLDALAAGGFIVRYEVDGEVFGAVPRWRKHQVVNQREAKSTIPERPANSDRHVQGQETHVRAYAYRGENIAPKLRDVILERDGHKCLRCGAVDDLTVDHIFPRSIGGRHEPANLRTLCRPCNSARPVAGQGLIDDLARDGLTLDDMQRTCTHQMELEGKGREGERKGCSVSKETAAGAAPKLRSVPTSPPERELSEDGRYYRFGREVLGGGAGGVLTKLKTWCDGDVRLATDMLEKASGKDDPRAWIAGTMRDHSDIEEAAALRGAI